MEITVLLLYAVLCIRKLCGGQARFAILALTSWCILYCDDQTRSVSTFLICIYVVPLVRPQHLSPSQRSFSRMST